MRTEQEIQELLKRVKEKQTEWELLVNRKSESTPLERHELALLDNQIKTLEWILEDNLKVKVD